MSQHDDCAHRTEGHSPACAPTPNPPPASLIERAGDEWWFGGGTNTECVVQVAGQCVVVGAGRNRAIIECLVSRYNAYAALTAERDALKRDLEIITADYPATASALNTLRRERDAAAIGTVRAEQDRLRTEKAALGEALTALLAYGKRLHARQADVAEARAALKAAGEGA